jgi:hypothetical protein
MTCAYLVLQIGGRSLSLSGADEKTIRRIKDGARKAYPEQLYVDPALIPGLMITFLCGIFLILSLMIPGDSGLVPFEIALFGTLIGIFVLVPGIAVWLYYRNTYSLFGLRRFQVALSITALELANLGHKSVQPIISPIYPEEYRYLPLFTAIGPGNLLKRMKEMQWDSETLVRLTRQSETYNYSMLAFVGVLSLIGGLIGVPAILFLSLISGAWNLIFLIFVLMVLVLGVGLLLYSRHRLRTLNETEPAMSSLDDDAQGAQFSSSQCDVEDVLSIVVQSYSHPIRLLVVNSYTTLEYTGRVYHTGEGIEVREAYLLSGVTGR